MADLGVVLKAAILAAAAAGVFLYGLAVGHYRIATFDHIRALKQRFDPQIAWLRANAPGFFLQPRPLGDAGAPIEVVMLGDSITALGDWETMFPQTRIANLGVGGDTSAGVLNRLENAIALRPRRVLLMIGVNDLLLDFPVELVATLTQFVAERLSDSGITPIVQATLYVSDRKVNEKIRALNATMRAWCDRRSIVYIDLNDELAADGILRPRFTDDGIHLTADAYRRWSEVIRRYIVSAQPAAR